jgi:hypothetical protein
MRRLFATLLLLGSLATAFASGTVTGRVVKVLPLLLDSRGRDAVSPSLYDRDAYQVYLRQHTNEISAIRFAVWWKASNARDAKLKLRVELRGVAAGGLPRQTTLEQTVTPGYFRRWTSLTLDGRDYKNFGELVAWRATLWSDDQLLATQKSFLW